MVVEVSWCPESLADVCGHLYRWQTLAGGLAPLFAGYLAFKSVRDQTSVLQKEALDRRLRLTRSFRAGLPEDAANIGRYCRDCARKRAEKWLRDLKLRFSRYLGNKLLVSIDQ